VESAVIVGAILPEERAGQAFLRANWTHFDSGAD
jgi:hypothetical protein